VRMMIRSSALARASQVGLCLTLIAALVLASRTTVAAQDAQCWTEPPSLANGVPQWTTAPQMVIDPAKAYTAQVETTMGTITIALDAAAAPTTVNNFYCLAQAGYYDLTIFHRVISGFMIQGGDPTGLGTGGPGYQFNDELPTAPSPYVRGTLAMANAGANTNGSQFFIVQQDQPAEFPSSYSIFGHVTEGMDVVDAIAAVPVSANAQGDPSSPTERVGIVSITIEEGAPSGATPAATAGAAGTVPTPTVAVTQPVATEAPAGDGGDDDDSNLALWIAAGAAVVVAGGYGIWRGLQRDKAKPVARSQASRAAAAPKAEAKPAAQRTQGARKTPPQRKR